jgi:hypothetical protein
VTATQGGFVYWTVAIIACDSGDTSLYVSTTSPTNVAADAMFFFSVYGAFPVASPLTAAVDGKMPTTCTITASTGVETCK